jgi:predicted NBD/HSP70 family sugar kinase
MANSARFTNNLYYDVARTVRDEAAHSRASISSLLNRSPATVGRVVDQLILENILYETGEKSRDNIGRPSKVLKFNSRINSVLTVDLRSTEVYTAVTDLAGDILVTSRQSISRGDTAKSILELVESIKKLMQEAQDLPPIAALVIGAPSIINMDDGIIEWAPSLGWRNIPLRRILEEEFHSIVILENDVNLAAQGEFWKGAGRKTFKNMLFVSVGTGIGAGIILNGDLYTGATHAAGEVAYFITDVNVLRENGGEFGNLESRIGRDGLVRTAQLVAQRYPTSLLADLLSQHGNSVRTQDILTLAEQGDIAASVVYKDVVDILTIVIGNSTVLLDPELIVLGGPSEWNWAPLIEEIRNCLGTNLLRPVNLVPSELGHNALILGGCYTALNLLPCLARLGK